MTRLSWKSAATFGGAMLLLAGGAIFAVFLLAHDWADARNYSPSVVADLPTSLSGATIARAPAERQLCCAESYSLDRDGETMTFRLLVDQPAIEGSLRAEIRSLSSQIGEGYRYRGDIRADKGWEFTAHPTIAMQWHGAKDLWFLENGRKPPLVIHAIGKEWVVSVNADPALVTPFKSTTQERVIARFPVTPGAWESMVFDVLWSPGPEGRITIYRNGEEIARDRGPNCFNDLVGPYFKFGNYQPKKVARVTAPSRVLSFRNVAWEKIDGRNDD